MKKTRNQIRQLVRQNEPAASKPEKKHGSLVPPGKILEDVKFMGLQRGDTVLLHSSLDSLGLNFIHAGKLVLDGILDVLGPEGTLAVPAYTIKGTMYETCKDKHYMFDRLTIPKDLGIIPVLLLRKPGVARSMHPTHSIAAIGKHAVDLTCDHHLGDLAFGDQSPWGKLARLGGKILGIGVNLGPNTFHHHVEDMMGDAFPVPVKIRKAYHVKVKQDDGTVTEVPVRPLDPLVARYRIDQQRNQFIQEYFWEIFTTFGVLHAGNVGNAGFWWVHAKEYRDLCEKLARLGITIYSREHELVKKRLYPLELIQDKLKGMQAP